MYFDGTGAWPLSRSGTRNRKSGWSGRGGGSRFRVGTCAGGAGGGGIFFIGKSGRDSISVSVPESDIEEGIFLDIFI